MSVKFSPIPVILVLLAAVAPLHGADKAIIPVSAEFTVIKPGDDFTAKEKSGLEGLNQALKVRLTQSPYFKLSVAEKDRMIHGKISRIEGRFLVSLYVTDFATGQEVAAASAEFLSFTEYAYAVELLVGQLEGREVALRTTREIQTAGKFILPDLKWDGKTGGSEMAEMEGMLTGILAEGDGFFKLKEYGKASETFRGFVDRFDTRLSGDFRTAFQPLRDYAQARWELSLSLYLFDEAGRQATAENFEKSLSLYRDAVGFIDTLPAKKEQPFTELYNLASDAVVRLDPICHDLLLAREKEFLFKINYFAFTDNPKQLKAVFSSFYKYADGSRYLELVSTNFNRMREFYRKSFDLTGIPAFWVFLSGGSFVMGNEGKEFDEKPEHTVTVDGFWISPFEVTMAEFDEYCKAVDIPRLNDSGWSRYEQPAINLSWYEVIEYCNWRSEKEGLIPCYEIRKDIQDKNNWNAQDKKRYLIIWNRNANGYRLPTEAEWEYAARGGSGAARTFYAGSDQLDDYGWYVANSGGRAHPVGQKAVNPAGLYDMSGNVWEMCWDWYERKHYQLTDGAVNPVGPENGNIRVARGGSYSQIAENSRVYKRNGVNPDSVSSEAGFRLVRNGLAPASGTP
jgi:formylglycine-generating enzyme required for sulfatase activity